MSVAAAGIYVSLLISAYPRHVSGDRISATQQADLSATGALVAMDPDVELVLKRVGDETDVEELLELCAVEKLKFHDAGTFEMPTSIKDFCRTRLRDLMIVSRETKNDVEWKFVSVGVPCIEPGIKMSMELCKCQEVSREDKKTCAKFCQGRAGFTLFKKPGGVHCSCCGTMRPRSGDGMGDGTRQYKLASAIARKRASKHALVRKDKAWCHPARLQNVTRGTVNFLTRSSRPVEVLVAKETPREFFSCPHLRIEDAAVDSHLYGGNTVLVWMYPSGKNPVWCKDSNEHFHSSVWNYVDVNNESHDVSVCHINIDYPLPMIKARKRTSSIRVDDVATYGHVEMAGRREKGVCKNLFLALLETANDLMKPLVVELGFNAQPADRACGCYAGAFFTKFQSLSLTIDGVSFDICSAAELAQICGSAELLKGQWSMRPLEDCHGSNVTLVKACVIAACVFALAVAIALAWLRRRV
mmetsp:Transcript_93572/g.180424  ORF Transcript_93572/g.180424 Transcript_93572/m.180424 type:complete len:471 (-) Transcript_93572:8-1420(-)